MFNCQHPGPPRKLIFDILKDQRQNQEDNVKKPKVERQFGRISDPNASWVLVTGFPEPATDRILMTFRSVGRIVGKYWSKVGLHLQFSNPCESARAVELDNLCIAGYPVRIYAIPRFSCTSCPSCPPSTSCLSSPLRQMGEDSCRRVPEGIREMEPCNLEFIGNWLINISRFLETTFK